MSEKTCKGCLTSKPAEAFCKNKASKDGLFRLCKQCNAAALKKRNDSSEFKAKRAEYLSGKRDVTNAQSLAAYWRNVEKRRAEMRSLRNKNKEARIAAAQEWRLKNPDKVKANRDRWFAERPGYVSEKSMRRYATKKAATPKWADIELIQAKYAMSSWLSIVVGVRYNVDHIVPIRGKNVTGLHTHDNLAIILADENRRKSNKHTA